jgi:hypothetical protein
MTQLTTSALARGSSADRQRAGRASGGLRHVIDTLAAETRHATLAAGTISTRAPVSATR